MFSCNISDTENIHQELSHPFCRMDVAFKALLHIQQHCDWPLRYKLVQEQWTRELAMPSSITSRNCYARNHLQLTTGSLRMQIQHLLHEQRFKTFASSAAVKWGRLHNIEFQPPKDTSTIYHYSGSIKISQDGLRRSQDTPNNKGSSSSLLYRSRPTRSVKIKLFLLKIKC